MSEEAKKTWAEIAAMQIEDMKLECIRKAELEKKGRLRPSWKRKKVKK
jgi:hypothetical protein